MLAVNIGARRPSHKAYTRGVLTNPPGASKTNVRYTNDDGLPETAVCCIIRALYTRAVARKIDHKRQRCSRMHYKISEKDICEN